jgi:hypothetical protein
MWGGEGEDLVFSIILAGRYIGRELKCRSPEGDWMYDILQVDLLHRAVTG